MESNKIAERVREANKIKKQFDACQRFKEAKGILRDAKRSIEFYEGRQWGDFKGKLPFEKPRVNIIQNIIDGKVASINQKVFKINYVVDNDQASTNKVTNFTDYQLKEMDIEGLNMRSSYDALLKGTAVLYSFWNEDKIGTMGNVEGAVETVLIDIKDIAVSNPNEKDIQKQEWVILRSRESVDYVKQCCEDLTDEEKDEWIHSKPYETPYSNDFEQDDEEMCFSYLKMFRQDGEVYFEKATDNFLYQEARSSNPLTMKEAIKRKKSKIEETDTDKTIYEEEPVNRRTMDSINEGDELTTGEVMENKYKANQYPVVIYSFIERDNCIFGLSLVEQLIPTQKIINQLIATNVLTAVKSAMPTLIVKEGALGTANIDLSKPNGIIVDRSGYGVSDAIKVLNAGTIPTTHYELAQSMINLTKDVYRANDILNDGRAISSNMSGVAISQLTQIRDMPIAQYQQTLSRAIGRLGKVLEMFYKLFYRNKRFSYELSDSQLAEMANANPGIDQNALTHSQSDIFNGAEYLDTPFSITVEVGETSKFSELVLSATLETLFLNGVISNLSTEDLLMYTELVPEYMFPKKAEFKRLIMKKQNSIVAQQQQQIEQLQGQLEQSQVTNQALQQEFTDKINQYNEQLKKFAIMNKPTSSGIPQ